MDWMEGRDHWWADLVRDQPDDAPTEEMPADSPFLLIYTSGQPESPRGLSILIAGSRSKRRWIWGSAWTLSRGQNLWMSDMGWLVGPSLSMVVCFWAALLCWWRAPRTIPSRIGIGG